MGETGGAPLTDLRPLFADRCWQYVLLARKAPVGVVMRRGPSKWWRLTLWDTRHDRFTAGQWFHGSVYPEKCDLSPDGKLLSCFAGKFRPTDEARGYGRTWVAVSRPPYFTALALWPVGDTWGGRTCFLEDGSFHAGVLKEHHPDHPPGPLRMAAHSYLNLDDPLVWGPPWARHGWVPIPLAQEVKKKSHFDVLLAGWKKTVGKLCLARSLDRGVAGGEDAFPSRRRVRYTLFNRDESRVLAEFEAHWADFDQRDRLVATVGGRILTGAIDRHRGLQWQELAGFQDEKPERMEAPGWARRW